MRVIVFQREPGESKPWYVRYTSQGKRVWKSIGTRAEAEEYAARLRARLLYGEDAEPVASLTAQDVTFAELVEMYVERVVPAKSTSTQYGDRMQLAYFVDRWGTLKLSRLTPAVIEKWRAERLLSVSKATINRQAALLSGVLTSAVLWRLLPSNPVREIKFYRVEMKRQKFLLPEQVERLLSVADDDTHDFVLVAVSTGLRAGNIFGMRWEDVDFETGVIRVPMTKTKREEAAPMSDRLRVRLAGRRQRFQGERYVFPIRSIRTARSEHRTDIRARFYKALRVAGLPRIRIHDLRHTFATGLLMAGVNLRAVQDAMGHSNLNTTQRYLQLLDDQRRASVSALPWSASTSTPPTSPPEPV